MNLESVTADSVPLLARFLADSRSVYLLLAALDGSIQLLNTVLSDRLKINPSEAAAHSVWDLIAEQAALSLRGRLSEKRQCLPGRFLLNFVDADHCPFTLECRLDVQPGYFLLLGEIPQHSNEASQEGMLQLNNELSVLSREHARRGKELERTLEELKTSHWHLKKIQEVLPLCMECGMVKTTTQWEDVVSYLKENAPFLSHGYCPVCLEKIQAQWADPPQE